VNAVNPYRQLVAGFERLVRDGREYPLGGFPPPPRPTLAPDAPRALIFSPHPDDECIIGGLALRLLREAGMRMINVAVTLGSLKARRAGRRAELEAACDYLGFELLHTAPDGLENINIATRAADPAHWQAAVAAVAAILDRQRPAVLFFPHDADWNSSHVGTHHLVMDALARQPAGFACDVVETEFWGAMATPNLMVEVSGGDLADMITALSFHAGEVKRNPYHLLVAPWMQDNVRRGGELVGGQGGAAPDFAFCTLYRLRRWDGGRLQTFYERGRSVPAADNAIRAFDRDRA
jgi:LmbE family N-acetylglucosaminyl deacetylase